MGQLPIKTASHVSEDESSAIALHDHLIPQLNSTTGEFLEKQE